MLFRSAPNGALLPGAAKLSETFEAFQADLPNIARAIEFAPNEIGGLKNYRTFVWCVAEFLKRAP